MGPYETTDSGNRFILVVTDLLSKWVEAFPLGSSTTKQIGIKLEEEVFSRYGYPRTIITDNGPQFTNTYWNNLCQSQWKVEHWTTATYHPQANPTERRNQEIKKGLRIQLHGRPPNTWDRCLHRVLFTLRRRRNAATRMTPAEVLTGRNLAAPGYWQGPLEPAAHPHRRQRVRLAARNIRNYQAARFPQRGVLPTYRPGQLVLTRNHIRRNMGEKWSGPYEVNRSAGHTTYYINTGQTIVKRHVKDIRPAPTARDPPTPPTREATPPPAPVAAPRRIISQRQLDFGPDIHQPVDDAVSEGGGLSP